MKSRIETSAVMVLYVVAMAFLLVPSPRLDPDFGWHLRSGQLINETGQIPRTDWFSFSAPNHPWVNHEWLLDSIVAFAYDSFGEWGVRFWYLVLTGIFVIGLIQLLPKHCPQLLRAALAVVASIVISLFHLQRSQIVTFIMFLAVLEIFRRARDTKSVQLFYFLPFVFLAWANLHAGFPIAFVALLILFFGELVKYWVVLSDEAAAHWGISFDKDKALSPEQIKAFIIAIFLSSLAILFTPYGVGMLEEVWRTMSDPHAKLIIGEWRATDLTSLSGLLFFLSSALLMAIGLASRNKIDATHALFLIAFFVIGLTAVRLTYFFLLIMFWVFLPKIPKSAFTSFSMTPLAKQPLMSVLMVVVIGAGFADIGIGIANRSSSLSEPALLAADSWLKKPNIKVFAETCWGGFLLYQYPKMKLFVDGRMNHWEYDSDRTFLKFSQDLMALQGDWKETLESLDPECIVISTPRPLASVLSELSAKWILVHKDDATSVFCKPK